MLASRPKDQMDGEWMMWTALARRSWMWIAAHVVLSESVRGLGDDVG